MGFAGGKKKGPTYYSLGDHTETVEIHFDPKKTSYRDMLKLFWENHDPTRCASRQYMSAIFYHGDEQRKLAEETRDARQKQLTKKIVTKITPAESFYNAEDYHQKYLLRQQRDILRELNLSEAELITSYAACRLNGYCGGYGSVTNFDKESKLFKLSPSALERARKIVARGSMH